ncbi:hypothetical protein [Phyllobacterium myrsinacearum]|uniref:Uncharacterized protein n=1 Tax=Phyllobacterium myrsinacearum TaxID=28101 RepID=A0A839EJQ5_9HYPH|nr:hypothetical protein [Phyllobacterium myrsinacearum]MBA8879029.1 hypothetical protein [Phyllobacterium myrsinacearum]
MRKFLGIIVIAALVGIAAVYFMYGPSFLMGGPKTSDIVNVSRSTMVATATSPSEADLARSADISPKGLCNHVGEGYACIVNVRINGAAPTSLVTVLKKGSDGTWISAN